MKHQTDQIIRRGEDVLCGVQVLTGEDHMRSHDAMHVRSEVVARIAIESSARGDGRFIEGPGDAVVGVSLAMTTFHGAVARTTREMNRLLDELFGGEDGESPVRFGD